MTIEIHAHPVESKEESDSYSFKYTFRLQVLDVATGLPLRFACATLPVVDDKMRKVLDKRGSHPFKFAYKNKIQVTFRCSGMKNFTAPFPCLKTFVPNNDLLPEAKKISLKETDTRVPEIFGTLPDSGIYSGPDGTLFVQVRPFPKDLTPRYVMVNDAKEMYAKRSLATNFDGVLEIPIKPWDWINCTSIKVKLRDYDLLEADGEFAPERLVEAEQKAHRTASDNGHRSLTVRLAGKPDDFTWWARAGNTWRKFKDVITFSRQDERLLADPRPTPQSFSQSTSFTATVWAVRRTLQAAKDNDFKNIFNDTKDDVPERRGIVIHYNSGYNLEEKRGGGWTSCKDIVNKDENHFPLDLIVDFYSVKNELDKNGNPANLGYNYHIGRDGTIVLAGDENHRMNHAHPGKEMPRVKYILGTHTDHIDIENPEENINTYCLGVVVVGDDHDLRFHFNNRQVWYLDRLIENLRMRYLKITWCHIQSHQEVREALGQHDRTDPGAALPGGMEELRGRHVNPVPLVPGEPTAV
jgi:hypothetical protein